MFKTEKVEKLIKYALLSGFVKNDVPLSLMLVSPPEHAKTSIIRGIKCKNAYETADLSPKPIIDKVIPMLLNDHIHHIVIPDFVKPCSHKAVTVDSTVAFLNAMIEEGVQNQDFFGQSMSLPRIVRAGLITSLTPAYFNKYFKRWNDIGFLTRFLVVSYSYSDTTKSEIHNIIKENKLLSLYSGCVNATEKIHSKFCDPVKKKEIKIQGDEASFLSVYAQDLTKKINTFRVAVYSQGGHVSYISPQNVGFRLQRQLRMLASTIALSNNDDTVHFRHIEELKGLIDFIGYPDKPVVI
jgi:hypothetical protein